ncbi:MAG: zf-TFIIB domain-containing protein [Ardenticatenaceae bacterium]|nr:zf-TFIIB domain-containing protein [Ardenticatenaceae bacterium]
MMRCPRDQRLLREKHYRNIQFSACEKCGGILVELGELERAKLAPDNIAGEDAPGPLTNTEERKIRSPVTGQLMERYLFHGVKLDICPDSGHVWLDAGELDLIRKHLGFNQDSNQRKDPLAGLDGIGWIFEFISSFN